MNSSFTPSFKSVRWPGAVGTLITGLRLRGCGGSVVDMGGSESPAAEHLYVHPEGLVDGGGAVEQLEGFTVRISLPLPPVL